MGYSNKRTTEAEGEGGPCRLFASTASVLCTEDESQKVRKMMQRTRGQTARHRFSGTETQKSATTETCRLPLLVMSPAAPVAAPSLFPRLQWGTAQHSLRYTVGLRQELRRDWGQAGARTEDIPKSSLPLRQQQAYD
uniref:Uncharacterized protein n=1 Tax=Eutreptiella gymnastica TaxID=73025 RepID=A0A7S4CS03_9EUGL